MKGSLLSLPTTAMLIGSLVVLSSCAGGGGQPSTSPEPKEAPAAKPTGDSKPTAAQPAPAKPAETTNQPKPAEPTPAPAPTVIDSTEVAAEFCKKITSGIQKEFKADSGVADPDAVVRKVAAGVPDQTVSVALAKGTTCR